MGGWVGREGRERGREGGREKRWKRGKYEVRGREGRGVGGSPTRPN